ncbi:hypothetical protein BD324DRAFT_607095 [Kockovaella imperatae]|uniref:Uncharacterized protein n=1 Tax=Kockovaella imperatae TaxID=4999 RepID=A0A1Y1UPJ6_9TREE|nr:hypothetical protein BD324DRAFT_607095 [Kockovaella imperatae]ORX39929.1 hypothetical protein BD324DRAFT_607095 [Kockovaella imperatae]
MSVSAGSTFSGFNPSSFNGFRQLHPVQAQWHGNTQPSHFEGFNRQTEYDPTRGLTTTAYSGQTPSVQSQVTPSSDTKSSSSSSWWWPFSSKKEAPITSTQTQSQPAPPSHYSPSVAPYSPYIPSNHYNNPSTPQAMSEAQRQADYQQFLQSQGSQTIPSSGGTVPSTLSSGGPQSLIAPSRPNLGQGTEVSANSQRTDMRVIQRADKTLLVEVDTSQVKSDTYTITTADGTAFTIQIGGNGTRTDQIVIDRETDPWASRYGLEPLSTGVARTRDERIKWFSDMLTASNPDAPPTVIRLAAEHMADRAGNAMLPQMSQQGLSSQQQPQTVPSGVSADLVQR